MQLWHIVNLPQRLKSVFFAKNHFHHQTQIQFCWPIYWNCRWVNPHCNNLSIFRPFYSSRHHQFLWQLWLLLLDITWIAITMMFVNVTHYIVLWVVIENTPHTSCECLWLFCFWDPKITRSTTTTYLELGFKSRPEGILSIKIKSQNYRQKRKKDFFL